MRKNEKGHVKMINVKKEKLLDFLEEKRIILQDECITKAQIETAKYKQVGEIFDWLEEQIKCFSSENK